MSPISRLFALVLLLTASVAGQVFNPTNCAALDIKATEWIKTKKDPLIMPSSDPTFVNKFKDSVVTRCKDLKIYGGYTSFVPGEEGYRNTLELLIGKRSDKNCLGAECAIAMVQLYWWMDGQSTSTDVESDKKLVAKIIKGFADYGGKFKTLEATSGKIKESIALSPISNLS